MSKEKVLKIEFGTVFVNNIQNNNSPMEVTDIYEQDEEVTFSVYPNPATSEVNVVWHSLQTKNPTIRLFSLDGKQIEVPQTTKGLGNTNLNVTGLAKGVYMLELNDGTRTIKRITIQ